MKKRVYLLLSLIFLLIIAMIIILNSQNKIPPEINDKLCNSDSDCVIVATLDSSNSCCTTCSEEAVTKQAEMKRNEWYTKNCKNVECTMYDCYNERSSIPRCVNNLCEVE